MIAARLAEEVLRAPGALDDALARRVGEGNCGLEVAAPGRVELPLPGPLHLAGCNVETLREAVRRPAFEDAAIVVGANLKTGRVRSRRAFPESTVAEDPPPPAPDPGEGVTGSAFRVDLAERLEFPNAPGAYCIWMLARERISNPLRIELVPRAKTPIDDPEVARFIANWKAEHRGKPAGADPRSVWPAESLFGGYPSYRARDAALPLPERGVALRAERVLARTPALRWVLQGSYRVRIDRRHVVVQPVSGESATAVVPLSLIFMASHLAAPVQVDLRLPSRSAIRAGDPEPLAEGYFTINLANLRGVRTSPGTYYIHAVCGEAISATLVSALVSQETLEA
jgi:hypothetical protein